MNENVDEIWENDEWTFQARQIIKNVRKFAGNSKLIMILRHSHRKDSRDVKEMIDMGLTPLGRKIARKFGELF